MSAMNPKLAKMDPIERAKQFVPFSALTGYEEALRAKELEVEARMERELPTDLRKGKTDNNTDITE